MRDHEYYMMSFDGPAEQIRKLNEEGAQINGTVGQQTVKFAAFCFKAIGVFLYLILFFILQFVLVFCQRYPEVRDEQRKK